MFADAEDGRVGRAPAHIHIDHLGVVLRGVGGCARAPPGDLGLHVGPGHRDHEIPGEIGEGVEDRVSILGSGRFTGNDHRARLDLAGRDARPQVLLPHQVGEPCHIHLLFGDEGGEVDGTLIEDGSGLDADARGLSGSGRILDGKVREDDLGGGGANVDADADHVAGCGGHVFGDQKMVASQVGAGSQVRQTSCVMP